MTEDDDKTLTELFGEAAKMEMADDGFTDGVMGRLDAAAASHARRILRIWTAVCCAAGLALLINLYPTLIGDISSWIVVMPKVLLSPAMRHTTPLLLLIPYAVAICMAIYVLADRERLSDLRL